MLKTHNAYYKHCVFFSVSKYIATPSICIRPIFMDMGTNN